MENWEREKNESNSITDGNFKFSTKKRRGGIRKKKQFFLSVLVYLKTRENILFADIQENCGRRWDYIDEEMMPNTAKVNREPNGTEMAWEARGNKWRTHSDVRNISIFFCSFYHYKKRLNMNLLTTVKFAPWINAQLTQI